MGTALTPTTVAADHTAALSGAELVTLQLVAHGYSPDQVAALRGVPRVAVLDELLRAVEALGTANVRDAIAEARCRLLLR